MVRFTGSSVARVEDRRILSGRGRYVDDVTLPGMLHAAFVRSPVASARIGGLDVSAASAAPGVVAVLTGADVSVATGPIGVLMATGETVPEFYALATDRVRFVGDPVAMVIARSRHEAEDGCELVEVDYDVDVAIASVADALAPDARPVFEDVGTNLLFQTHAEFGDVASAFAAADRVVDATLRQHRVAVVPMETRGAIADFRPATGELTYYASCQGTHGLRLQLAQALDHPLERLRVIAGDVGGAFGLKGGVFREDLCLALASRRLGTPVKWIEDRNEHLLAAGHAREETIHARVAVRADGGLLGLEATLTMDGGAYPKALFPADSTIGLIQTYLPGPYRFSAFAFHGSLLTTNKCTYVAYRGPWEMETWTRERLLDIVARELDLDPVEVRRANMMTGEPDDRLLTGPSLAGITSRETLDRAVARIDYARFRADQQAARVAGRYLGIGFATFIEAAPGPPEGRVGMFGWERAGARLEIDGRLTVITPQQPHGQGHETTLAQIAADEMGVAFDDVRVVYGDTQVTPFSLLGTGGSRAATWAAGAVRSATRVVREKVLAIAAAKLEIAEADLEISEGVVAPRGDPELGIPLSELAYSAALDPTSVGGGSEANLEASVVFDGEGISGSGWSGGTHACVVEVDVETGRVSILRYLVVEDCGPVIHPAIVEGQIRGGVAQGIGEVLFENAAYDADGNFLAGTFLDYLIPTASEIPDIEIEHVGAEADVGSGIPFRGVGEGGALVAPAALTNAIEDALAPFGARVRDQFLPPSRILELAGVVPASA